MNLRILTMLAALLLLGPGCAVLFPWAVPPEPVEDGGTFLPDGGAGADGDGGWKVPDPCAEDAPFSASEPPLTPLDVLDAYCDAVAAGMGREWARASLECGAPLDETDLLHFAPDCGPGWLGAQVRQLERSVVQGRMAFDGAAMSECVELGRATDGGAKDADGGLPEPCRRALRGEVAPGGACEHSEECAGETFCRAQGPFSCGGTCLPPLAPGANCEPERDLCSKGTHCRPDAAERFSCVARLAKGEACLAAHDCEEGLACAGGSCALPAGEGESCAEVGCASGLVCAGEARTCQRPRTTGESCGPGLPRCGSCLRCDEATGQCLPLGPSGAGCQSDLECGPGLRCDQATWSCALLPRSGEPCTTGSGCLYPGDFCRRSSAASTLGICWPLPDLGGQCGRFDLGSCVRGYCRQQAGEEVGHCAPLPAAKERCGTAPGLWAKCQEGLVCATSACEAAGVGLCVELKLPGASCGADGECEHGRCASGRCEATCNVLQRSHEGCRDGLQLLSMYLLLALVFVARASRKASPPCPPQRPPG